MSFFKKTLASFGIGSAKVDSVLQQDVLYAGQQAELKIHVYGGASAQEIDNIDVKLCCRYIAEVAQDSGDRESQLLRRVAQTYVLDKWTLPYAFTIQPGEERVFDVSLAIPCNTPITLGDARVWLETGLDVAMAVDPTDKDSLTVRPDALMDGIFTALEEKGLRIRQVECEAVEGFELPFVQEFEFVPTAGPYHGRWRELEMVAYRKDDGLSLWFEVDRLREGGKGMLASLLGAGKLKRELTIPLDVSGQEAGARVVQFLEQST
ncbi:sporulation control protein Spo0M [Vibrio navarrensis]|uniref:Sporulation protein n=1 Tax=Vibrio navarrensis TaxID=29495 RepID=A0AAI9CXL2_9VIBR|nr:sporulation protein [Vibrio navarrensis]EGR2797763.1 sporulation control protein Spo0M [Vibrio navarrensis]EJK2115633.1 sporulation protein [Vibrio navarrensis]EJL6396203.1 sporulation protein [Vibrio navarrensis]EKA5636913.1 sporulation protein [Vibrio navarrensis]ELN6934230.1 sporulation protein [Vibrio navarrensis]